MIPKFEYYHSARFLDLLACIMISLNLSLMLTGSIQDIVHGDVKCENVLVFEEPDGLKGSNAERESTPHGRGEISKYGFQVLS